MLWIVDLISDVCKVIVSVVILWVKLLVWLWVLVLLVLMSGLVIWVIRLDCWLVVEWKVCRCCGLMLYLVSVCVYCRIMMVCLLKKLFGLVVIILVLSRVVSSLLVIFDCFRRFFWLSWIFVSDMDVVFDLMLLVLLLVMGINCGRM